MNAPGLKDIRGPVALPGDGWWLWLLLLAAGLGLVFWAVRYFRGRMRPAVSAPLPVPPWERALAELARLGQLRPASLEELKEFYFRLSGVVRLYMEERFNIRAVEMTTEEFMERARSSVELAASHRSFLNDFLAASDMVKFARFEPSAQDRADALAAARRFVEGTRPVPPEGGGA